MHARFGPVPEPRVRPRPWRRCHHQRSEGRWTLRAARSHRPRWDGGRLPRAPDRPRPPRRAQGTAPTVTRRADAGGPVLARGPHGWVDEPSEHRHRPRVLRARRQAIHRDGVSAARIAAPVGRNADAPADGTGARGAARGTRPCRALRHRAPRRQAREPPRHRPGPDQGRRLRHRQGAHRQHQPLADRCRHDGRDADVYGP